MKSLHKKKNMACFCMLYFHINVTCLSTLRMISARRIFLLFFFFMDSMDGNIFGIFVF